eukprot:356412-Chlamydomonas_euryale.AAC.1
MSSNLEGSGDKPRVPHFCARSAIVRISGCRRSLTQKTSRKLIKISPNISPTGDVSPKKKHWSMHACMHGHGNMYAVMSMSRACALSGYETGGRTVRWTAARQFRVVSLAQCCHMSRKLGT